MGFSMIGWILYTLLYYLLPIRDKIFTTSFRENLCHKDSDILHIHYQTDYFAANSEYIEFFAIIHARNFNDFTLSIMAENKEKNLSITHNEVMHLPGIDFKFIPLPIRLNSSGVWDLLVKTPDKRICFKKSVIMK